MSRMYLHCLRLNTLKPPEYYYNCTEKQEGKGVLCICSSDPHALQILMNDLIGILAIAKVQYLHLKTE